MPRNSREPEIQCEFFTWKLFRRDKTYYADGRRHKLGKHSLGTTHRDEALKNLRDLDRAKAIERGLCTATSHPVSSSILTIAGGWDQFVEHVGRPDVAGGAAPSTQKRYRSARLNHERFCAQRGVSDWKEIDSHHLIDYAKQLQHLGFSPRTIHFELSVVKFVHTRLVRASLLPETSKLDLPLRRPHGSDTYCYTPPQVQRMIGHCESIPELQWLGHVILALALTGFRVGELLSLRRRDLQRDTDGTPIFIVLPDERSNARRENSTPVRRMKGRRTRQVPIHPRLRALLNSLPIRKDGALFAGPFGQPITYDALHQAFVDKVIEPVSLHLPADEQEEFRRGRFHSFRHFFVSQALLRGVSEGELRDWIGHRDTRLIELYRHLAAHESRRRMEQLDLLGDVAGAGGPPRSSRGPSGSQTEGGAATDDCPGTDGEN